jgi:hypothetical protein
LSVCCRPSSSAAAPFSSLRSVCSAPSVRSPSSLFVFVCSSSCRLVFLLSSAVLRCPPLSSAVFRCLSPVCCRLLASSFQVFRCSSSRSSFPSCCFHSFHFVVLPSVFLLAALFLRSFVLLGSALSAVFFPAVRVSSSSSSLSAGFLASAVPFCCRRHRRPRRPSQDSWLVPFVVSVCDCCCRLTSSLSETHSLTHSSTPSSTPSSTNALIRSHTHSLIDSLGSLTHRLIVSLV